MTNSTVDPSKEIGAVASAYIIMDADGNPWGPFKQAVAALEWAALKWRDQKEAVGDDYGNLSEGWTMYVLRHPDT